MRCNCSFVGASLLRALGRAPLLLILAATACDSRPSHDHQQFERDVLEQFSSPSAEVRAGAARSLGDMALSQGLKDRLLAALGDSSALVRVAAAETVVKLRGMREHHEGAVGVLSVSLRQRDPYVRELAIRALAADIDAHATVAELIASALDDPEPEVRAAAAEELSELGPRARVALPRLQAALRDTSLYVREKVRRALSAVRGR